MSKKRLLKFYSDPTQDPSFAGQQAKWYARLAREGFEDQENVSHRDRPLKQWSGVSSIYVESFQPPGEAIISSFPESVYKEEERFLNHREFQRLCVELSSHGNSRLTPKKVRLIWIDYCEGRTSRQSEQKYGISDNRICVLIQKITEWMHLMDTRPSQDAQETATIVLRKYKPESDNPIIYATWRNALWFDEKRDDRLGNEFFSKATKNIRAILGRRDVDIRIACDKEDPDFIAGYAVLTGSHLEMVYVKADYRKKGIGRLLTKGFRTVSEPQTRMGRKIVEKKNLEVKENHEILQ